MVVQSAEEDLLTCWKTLKNVQQRVWMMSTMIRALSNMGCCIDRMPDRFCQSCDDEDEELRSFDMFRGINFHLRGVAVDDTDIYWFRGARPWTADPDLEDVEQYDLQLRSAEI